jgi:hypothetical protein
MENIREALRRAARTTICLVASAAVGLSGFPMLVQAQAPQLLRTPERVLSAGDCQALVRRINFLEGRDYPNQLRATLASLQKMRAQAEQGKWEADRKLWEEAKKRAEEFRDDLKNMAVEGLEELQLRALIRSMHARGVLPAAQRLKTLKNYEDALRVLGERLDIIGDLTHDYTVLGKRLTDANSSYQQALSARDQFYRDWLSDDSLREYGGLLADLAKEQPLIDAGFKLGYVAITVGSPAYERYYLAPRDIADLDNSITRVGDALMRIDLDREMYQRQHQRYCKEPPSRQAQSSPEPLPPTPPPAQSSGSGGGVLTAALVVGGVALGAAALAAAAGHSASAGGCQAGQHQCQPPNGGICCPNGTTLYCTNGAGCTNLNSSTFGNLCNGNQPAAAPCGS